MCHSSGKIMAAVMVSSNLRRYERISHCTPKEQSCPLDFAVFLVWSSSPPSPILFFDLMISFLSRVSHLVFYECSLYFSRLFFFS